MFRAEGHLWLVDETTEWHVAGFGLTVTVRKHGGGLSPQEQARAKIFLNRERITHALRHALEL
jgi:hypothetical protein